MIPRVIGPAAVLGLPLRDFLNLGADDKPDALPFTGARGGSLRRSTLRREVGWYKAVAAIGMPGLPSMIFVIPATSSLRPAVQACVT